MTHRRRRTWAGTAIGAALLAAVTLLSVQGCAPAPADADTGAAHVPSLATAEDVYEFDVQASDAAAAADDEALALALVTAGQWAEAKSQYAALISTGTAVPRYRYGTPQFYVPALTGYPEWFLVAVPRRTVGPGGQLGPAVPTLMVFSQGAENLPWTLSAATVLSRPLPVLATTRDGYAVNVPIDDSSLLLQPDVVGATQATVVDEGPANPATAVVGAGPQTTGLYAAQVARARSDAAAGLQYQWLLEGVPYPQFALRTADGGALVLYGMSLNTTTEHPNLAAGRPIRVPADLRSLFTVPSEIGYHALWADWTYEFAATDPPPAVRAAKVQVIASQGTPDYAHAT